MRSFFKKSLPVFIVLFIAGIVFFTYTYVTESLKSYLSKVSEENFGAKLSIGYVGFGLPFCLELKDVGIDDWARIRKVQIYPNPAPFLLKNGLIVSTVKIIEPVVKIKKGKGRKFVIPGFLKKGEKRELSKIPASNFYFSRMRIQNGILIYDDGRENILEFIKIKGALEIPAFYLSKNRDFRFAATGFLKNKNSDFLAPLKIDGRMGPDNLIKAKLRITDIKLDALGSIYAKYLGRLIKEDRINFESDIQVSKSNLIARCFLKKEDIILKKGRNKKIETSSVASFILLFSFKNKILKLKNIQDNFLKPVLD